MSVGGGVGLVSGEEPDMSMMIRFPQTFGYKVHFFISSINCYICFILFSVSEPILG